MLREVVSDIWVIETPFQTVGLNTGARMTIVRRKDGTLFVYAPYAISDEAEAALRELGKVCDLVAPNVAHFTEIGEFVRRFPEATLWTLPEIDKRLGTIPHKHLETIPEEWKEDFDGLLVDGYYQFREWVFFHRATRSLIITDLSFHIPPPQTPLGRIAWRLNGMHQRFGTTLFVRNLVRFGKRQQVRQNIQKLLTWDFDRIIPGHGYVIEDRPKERLRLAYKFLDV